MLETESGTVSGACVATVTRRDLLRLVRNGWRVVGDEDGPSVMLYLNGAERDGSFDKYDHDVYARCNVSLESLFRLMRGETFKWGERYGNPLYIDSDGVDRKLLPDPP